MPLDAVCQKPQMAAIRLFLRGGFARPREARNMLDAVMAKQHSLAECSVAGRGISAKGEGLKSSLSAKLNSLSSGCQNKPCWVIDLSGPGRAGMVDPRLIF
jgi:hypothetical protein